MTMVYEKEQLTTGALDRMWQLRVPGSLVAIGPSFGITLLFIYGFIGWTAYISFSASKMTPNAKLVGLANYYKLWQFDSWVVAVSNLFIFTVLYVGIGMAVGLGLAILLDQRVRAEGFFRTIFLYPAALSLVVTGVVWKWLLNPGTGIEALAHDLGLSAFKFDWIINESTVLYAVVIAAVWQVAGFSMAIFLSGLRGVNDEVVKAARLDGASTARLYWHVIMPAIRSSFVTVFVLLTAFALKTFDLVVAIDEPLSNLDAQLRTEMRAEIKKLHEKLGTTIVYVTHDQIEAMTMATKIAIMQDGNVMQYGSPEDIYLAPANLFVAKFVGSPTINLIKASIGFSGGIATLRLMESDSRSELLQMGRSSLVEGDGHEALVGIRPECVRVVAAGIPQAKGTVELDSFVSATENTGSDLIVTVNFNGGTIVARLRPGEARANAPIRIAFDIKDVLVFDASTERRLNIVKEYAA